MSCVDLLNPGDCGWLWSRDFAHVATFSLHTAGENRHSFSSRRQCSCCVRPLLQNFLAALGAGGGQHPYPIFASLLRHACSRKLAVADCSAVLRVAKDQVRACAGLCRCHSYSLLPALAWWLWRWQSCPIIVGTACSSASRSHHPAESAWVQ
jgi:hypothetical protein